jgi:hypothetical protein
MIGTSSTHSAACFMLLKITRGQWSKVFRHLPMISSLGIETSGPSSFTFLHSQVPVHVSFNGTTIQMKCANPAHGSCFTVYGVFMKLISGALAPTGAPPARQRARGRRL